MQLDKQSKISSMLDLTVKAGIKVKSPRLAKIDAKSKAYIRK